MVQMKEQDVNRKSNYAKCRERPSKLQITLGRKVLQNNINKEGLSKQITLNLVSKRY